jgi:hypothetical protein
MTNQRDCSALAPLVFVLAILIIHLANFALFLWPPIFSRYNGPASLPFYRVTRMDALHMARQVHQRQ